MIRIIFAITFLAASCTQELDMPFPQGKEQLVLNSILHPDSTIKVSLTKTLPLGTSGSDFPVVDNAEIRLYEDDVLIGQPTFLDSVYVLDYRPQADRTYRVEVETPGFSTVEASDKMPEAVIASTCFEPSDKYKLSYTNSNAIQHIYIQDPPGVENNYWFYRPSVSVNYSKCEKVNGQIIKTYDCREIILGGGTQIYYSFSTVPDRFNAYVDALNGGVTAYDFYIRVEDQLLDGQQIHFDIAGYYTPNQQTGQSENDFRTNPRIISASKHFDRYLKSSVTYVLNRTDYADEDFEVNPFAEIVQTYSNVENGTGIFAAYNSVSFAIDDYPCRSIPVQSDP